VGFFLRGLADKEGAGMPLLVRLRDLRAKESLIEAILGILGVSLRFIEKLDRKARERARLGVLIQLLGDLRGIVMLDGLDELHPDVRDPVTNEIRLLLRYCSGYRVLVTCRTADFSRLENTVGYSIEPLSDAQVKTFAQQWLGQDRAQDLLEKIREAPYTGSQVLPLTLAHLCAIYERTGSVPEKPKTIYGKIVRLLLNEWDEQRSVQRASSFSNFPVDRKEEFLRALAFELTERQLRGSFDFIQIERAYRAVCDSFRLSESDCRRVLKEIEAHTGLILETSSETYDFAHRTFQEYLAAEFILRLPVFPRHLATRAPSEMALVVSMSSSSAEHFLLIVEAALGGTEKEANNFPLLFLRRLFQERVDFKSSRRLGKCVAELFASTFFPSARQVQLGIPFGVSSRIFRDFLSLDGVRHSVKSVLRSARIEPNGGETWRIRWQDGVALEQSPILGPGEWIVVDSAFLRQAGLRVEAD
jgi:hypothetical protein